MVVLLRRHRTISLFLRLVLILIHDLATRAVLAVFMRQKYHGDLGDGCLRSLMLYLQEGRARVQMRKFLT